MSVWLPPAMASHPCDWAGVGCGKDASNHAVVAGLKCRRGPDAVTDELYRQGATTRGAGQRAATPCGTAPTLGSMSRSASRRKASTTDGSNWVPELATISSMA